MTVRELLETTDSYELSEWMAYENAFGPLGNEYRDDMLAAQHEMLQALRHTMGHLWSGEDNEIPEPVKLPRPNDLYDKVFKDPEDEEDDYVSEGQKRAAFDSQFEK